jgi:hypothetical protein
MAECMHGIEEATCDYCTGKVAHERRTMPDGSYGPGRCRAATCGAPFVWSTNDKTGKASPIDPDPVPNGNIRLLGNGRHRVMGQRELEADTQGERFVNHFMTCPERNQFGGR